MTMTGQELLAEWLETDGLGGFASGTVSGIRTRRYHGLLLVATTPPTGRMLLVNGFDAMVRTLGGDFAISAQAYQPNVVQPDGATRIAAFSTEPWPRWEYRLEDGTRIEQELFLVRGTPLVAIRWRLLEPSEFAQLSVRPYFSGRDYHALHHANDVLRFNVQVGQRRINFHPYEGVPGVVACSNGEYSHEPTWYTNFYYAEERQRGLDCVEDLAAPGTFRWDLADGDAVLLMGVEGTEAEWLPQGGQAPEIFGQLRAEEERRRKAYAAPLLRAAEHYIVQRASGKTIVAGYPWFTDWGRDTFIAMRGLCLATGRLEAARQILLQWAGTVSEGMLPNRFPDLGDQPEYNGVDASLWYVIAVNDYLEALERRGLKVAADDEAAMRDAVLAILQGYARGTRYNISMDADGLVRAGEVGTQLTWMDVKIGDWVVTPRVGKPVEIEALWINALAVGARWEPAWDATLQRAKASFAAFWNADRGCLHDVIDVGHEPGQHDPTLRPNQIFALGGLPLQLLEGDQARQMLQVIERHLLTQMGLRSLAQTERNYTPVYDGSVFQRDAAYHQGTVWLYLMGPFVEAWLRVYGNTAENRDLARRQFLAPLIEHTRTAGLGHLSEIVDADPPHRPRGCPFQAWSLGELLRLHYGVLREPEQALPPLHEEDEDHDAIAFGIFV